MLRFFVRAALAALLLAAALLPVTAARAQDGCARLVSR